MHATEKLGIPFTPMVFVASIIFGASRLIPDDFLNEFMFSLDPDFLLLVFLPPLVYESASSVDYHTFMRQLGKILLMAFPMVLCATYLAALVMYYVLGYQDTMPWAACVLFGAVISATDPVAVVSLLKQLGAPKSIGTLIEGESLLNDGTAVVIFFIAIEFLQGNEMTTGEIFKKFFWMSFGGPILGIISGVILTECLKHVNFNPKLETNLTFCFPFLTFYIAELPSIHVSGILAVVFLGLYMSHRGKTQISGESMHTVHDFWAQLGFCAEVMIFVISGVLLGFDAVTGNHFTFENFGKTVLLYIFLTVIRQILLFAFYPLMKLTGYPIKLSYTALLTWGALRGALGMFLSLNLLNNPKIDRNVSQIILFHTSFIALLTLVVNGLTTGIVVQKLGLSRMTDIQKKFMWMFIEQVSVVQQKSQQKFRDAHKYIKIDEEKLFNACYLEKSHKKYDKYCNMTIAKHVPQARAKYLKKVERLQKGLSSRALRIKADPLGLLQPRKERAKSLKEIAKTKHEENRNVSDMEVYSEIRHRALTELHCQYLHQWKKGLLSPDNFIEMDGQIDLAQDHTENEFLHWKQLQKELKAQCDMQACGRLTQRCATIQWLMNFDQLINFIECSHNVQKKLKELVYDDWEEDEETDQNLKQAITDINKEIQFQITEANDIIEKKYKSKHIGVVQYLNNRRGQFFVLFQMKHYVKHELHQGNIDEKEANTLLNEIFDKIRALKDANIDINEVKEYQEIGLDQEIEASEERTQMIIRQAQNKINNMDPSLKVVDQGKNVATSVTYGKLISMATKEDLCYMYTGWIFASLAGIGMPVWAVLIGDLFDAFGPIDPVEGFEQIKFFSLIIFLVGIAMWICCYIYWSCLLIFAERIARAIKVKYLEAIFQQDAAWFDNTNYMQLSSNLEKQTSDIQKGIGEKVGSLIQSVAMACSGLILGLIKGWAYGLTLFGILPPMMLTTGFTISMLAIGKEQNLKAYAQCAGYSEQCLNAFKVVASFGMEEVEIKNYSRSLLQTKEAGAREKYFSGAGLALLYGIIYLCYSYGFYIGSIFVEKEVWNSAPQRAYSFGDIMGTFFGILFGLFAIGSSGNHFKGITDAGVAGKFAFDVIEKKSNIPLDDQKAKEHIFKGKVEFKNVNFFYPTKPSQKILDDFSCVFEQGQTTAIVGPSGSGKSTILALIERFYECEGEILIDGEKLKDVKLRHFRSQIGYVSQEPALLNDTIAVNMRLGNPEASKTDIKNALKATNSWKFVKKQKGGIDALANNFSGGQKQRLALARVFIKKPKLLIFDEATSALDKKNEAKVQKAISKMRKELGGVTSIVIAHRLTTIEHADKILVMKGGKLLETGSHSELLQNHPEGVYAGLIKIQEQAKEAKKDKLIAQGASIQQQKTTDLSAQDDKFENDTQHKKLVKIESKQHLKTESVIDEQSSDSEELQTKRKLISQDIDHAEGGEDEEPQKELTEQEQTLLIAKKTRKKQKKQAKKNLLKAQEKDKQHEKEVQDKVGIYSDKDNQRKAILKKISPYNQPTWAVVCGLIASVFFGSVMPLFGWLVPQTLFAMADPEDENMRKNVNFWCLIIFLCALCATASVFFQKYFFAMCGSNITYNVRKDAYRSILAKNLGWHDKRENNSSILTAMLSKELDSLDGMASETAAIMIEASLSLGISIVISLAFCWQVGLMAMATCPLMIIGAYLNSKYDPNEKQLANQYEETKTDKAQILAADSIQNYRTIASFASEQIIVEKYSQLNEEAKTGFIKEARLGGFYMGLAQFGMYTMLAILQYYSGWLMTRDLGLSGLDVNIAIWVIVFGGYEAGNCNHFMPDVAGGLKASEKVFKIIDAPSSINKFEQKDSQQQVDSETFKGKIQFKNVWFRYPTRPTEWVFKGLNLTINPNDCIAIVGESGQGKSTMINLVMRFYDPDEGSILIDDVDIKKYNVAQLRAKMGLVMQEPTLFNYSLKENILYGNQTASNKQIKDAAAVANAMEFIESNELDHAIEDNPIAIFKAFVHDKQNIAKVISQEEQGQMEKNLAVLRDQDEKSGKRFIVQPDVLDYRTDQQKGKEKLSKGFTTQAGIRGTKLSGGQKQRLAIARAIVRDPAILLLDEATSALDEESQMKVQDALEKVMKGRTSLVIAHRLTTVKACNRVALIEDGRVAEEGSYDKLMQQDGYFAKLAKGMKKKLAQGLTKMTEKKTEENQI